MLMDEPVQILVLAIVAAAGKGLIVMVTELDLMHPFELVSVTVYVVVTVGLTEGFAAVDVNPTGLLIQEYVLPATAVAPMLMDEPVQILVLAMVAAAGKGMILINILSFMAGHKPFPVDVRYSFEKPAVLSAADGV
jgi:hypothetical protein